MYDMNICQKHIDGISEDSLNYLAEAPEKALVIMQWMQRLIVQSSEDGIITAPAPVLSRVFQEWPLHAARGAIAPKAQKVRNEK